MANRCADLHEPLDGLLDLIVEKAPIGDNDHRIEDILASQPDADELVRQPGDRVRFSAAGRVLNQLAPAGAMHADVGQRLPHDAKLVVAREDLSAFLLAGLLVLGLDDLRVVFENVGQAGRRQRLFPEIVGFQAERIGRVTSGYVPRLKRSRRTSSATPQMNETILLSVA
jgi:hypothetical protein